MPRQCDSYCGFGDAYCCSSGQVCTTDAANVAACVAPTAAVVGGGGNDGSWNYYTTTIVDAIETTRVVTISSFIGAASTPQPYVAQSTAICYAPLISCGTICCASNQECYTEGQCRAKQDGSGGSVTGSPDPTAPVKGTSVIATTVPVTTTQGFVAPVETTGSSSPVTSGHKSGLSGGAIAGIVIGVIAGIIFLLLLCACCCLSAGIKGLWHLVAGKKKGDSRRGSRTEVTETRRHSTRYGGSAASRRETHGGWFGGAAAPSKSGRNEEKHDKHKKEAAGLAGLGLGLAALWAGMKMKKDKKKEGRRQSGSYYTSYSESYTGTTDSELTHPLF